MKFIFTILFVLISPTVFAGTACSDDNTQTQIARNAVKAMISLADAPNVTGYYGGVQGEENGQTVINIQPYFQYTKDWYKVSIRNSDCRVMNVNLFLEKIANNCDALFCPSNN